MPTDPATARRSGRGRTLLVLLGAAGALVLAPAGPAAALEDPRRPVAEVTHGPSCGPGVVRVQVVNGNQPTAVALVFDGAAVQDAASLVPAERVELGSADVGWGTTVHVTVTVADAAGTAQRPLDLGTYTRPSKADCDALEPGSGYDPFHPVGVPAAVPATVQAPLPPRGAGGTSPVPTPGEPVPASRVVPVGAAAPAVEDAVAATVAPGGVVRVRGSGFVPGEEVDVWLAGAPEPLATARAGADGAVEAVVQVPRAAAPGRVAVQLVGRTSSASSGLDLQVAPRGRSLAESPARLPALAAGSALVVACLGLGAGAARRPRTALPTAPPAVPTWHR